MVKGVEKLASVVWSAATAAAAYEAGAEAGILTDVSHGLSELASQAVDALQAIEGAMLWALDEVVGWVSQHVIAPILNPIVAGAMGYASALAVDVQNAASDAAVGSVPGSVSNQFWRDLGGSVFVVALTLSAAVLIGLNLLAGLCLGIGLVISLVLGFVLDAVMESVDHEVSPSIPSSSGNTRPTGAMVSEVAGVANSTPVNNTTPSDVSNATYGFTWSALAQIYSWSSGLFGFSLAWGAFCGAFIDPSGFVTSTVGLAAAITALILSFVSITVHTLACTLTVLAIAALSLFIDQYARTKPTLSSGDSDINDLTQGLDGVSLAVDFVVNHDRF